jgi:hypothetical protein
MQPDIDVDEIWWPELKVWIDVTILGTAHRSERQPE